MGDAPTLVRLGEKGGGDYTLRVVDRSWRVSHWIPGQGRAEVGRGDNFADGPVKLIQVLADYWAKRYAEVAQDIWCNDRIPAEAILRPGFRPGAHKRQAAQARAAWTKQVEHWLDTARNFLVAADTAGWPVQLELTMSWLETTIPKTIPHWTTVQ